MRDLAYEQQFFKNLEETVAARSGMNAIPLVHLIEKRMAMGAEQYGDSTFLTDDRDLQHEAREELADAIAYCLFSVQRLMATGEDHAEAVHHLFESSVLICSAEAHVRAAKLARRGV